MNSINKLFDFIRTFGFPSEPDWNPKVTPEGTPTAKKSRLHKNFLFSTDRIPHFENQRNFYQADPLSGRGGRLVSTLNSFRSKTR
jgi:hypothetical protein